MIFVVFKRCFLNFVLAAIFIALKLHKWQLALGHLDIWNFYLIRIPLRILLITAPLINISNNLVPRNQFLLAFSLFSNESRRKTWFA